MVQKTQTINLDDVIAKEQKAWDEHAVKMKPFQKKGREIRKRLKAAEDMKATYNAS